MNTRLTYLLTLLLLLSSRFGGAQTYGNEWINYNQKYYSFKVYPNSLPTYFGDVSNVETGIYILDYNTIVAAGIPVTSFSTANIQIFGREKEVPLHIVDGGDGTMDPGDYILFYTERNDGWLDSILFNSPTEHGNPFYSLYNDTLQYFFTWNNSSSNLRYTVEDNSDYGLYTPASYVYANRWQANTPQYREGVEYESVSESYFSSGEGWSSNKMNGAVTGYTWNSANVQFPGIYQGPGAPDVVYRGMQVGVSDFSNGSGADHHVRYRIGSPSYTFVDATWSGYQGKYLAATIPNSVFPASGNSNFYIDIVGDLPVATDYQSISYWTFNYPRTTSFSGESRKFFEIENSTSGSKVRLDLVNLGFNNPVMLAHGDVPRLLTLTQNGGAYTTVIPNSAGGVRQQIVYQDSSTFRMVDTLAAVNGTGVFTDFSAANMSEPLLMVYHPKLKTASDAYKAYRENDYNVVYANVEELYQQFGGGVPKHIAGIRRFSQFMYDQASPKPIGLFLMGKGIREATIGTAGTRKNASVYAQSLIPSFGEPSSDIAITAGFNPAYQLAPGIPTGRISARTEQELSDYLNKVITHEQQQDQNSVYNTPSKDWQKHVIHFAGGSSTEQQNLFQGYMNSMEYTIEDSLFGADVMRVYKSNSDPLDPTVLASVTDRISDGVSLMNYFGHASPTNSGFEINLDDPANWSNSGKYPLMLVNSCYNGNVFQTTTSKSEEFVQIPNAGAIGYIASTSIGVAPPLAWYSQGLYRHFAYKGYGKTIGEQMKNNIQDLESSLPWGSSYELFYTTSCQQMVLNGDPMVRVNHHDNPEIELLAENIWFTPKNLDLTVDSIEMHILLKNLGRSIVDTFNLEIVRDFPGTSGDSLYLFKIPELHYTKEFVFKMPVQANIGLGLNAFTVSADIPSFVNEQYDEIGNNQITKTLFIDVDGIIPVEPYDYAVVPIDSVTVKACTNNPIADFNTYRFEIDTIDFEGAPSPAHRFAIVSGYGGVKEVNPSDWTLTGNPGANGTLQCEDSVVYFWRVSIDGDTIWREHSFQYITNREGWGQDHFFQFKKNSFSGLEYDRSTRHRNFLSSNKTIDCYVYNSLSDASLNTYYVNGNLMEYGMCQSTPQLHVAVIDPITLDPWGTRYQGANPDHNFGNANDESNCRSRVEYTFIFYQNNATQMAALESMIDSVPNGHYILIYAPVKATYSTWPASMFTKFAALGSDSIFAGRPDLPFAFLCRKGDTNSVVELCSQNNMDNLALQAVLQGSDYIGLERTPLIGPAQQWHNVYWKQRPMEVAQNDTTILTISVYDASGIHQFDIDTAFTLNDSIINLNSLVDASQYPFIDLLVTYADTTTLTPAQVDRLHVLYAPLPEAAIDGGNAYYWSVTNNNTVMEGENIEFAVDVKNIFSVDMDSLLISYWVETDNGSIIPISYPRQDSLKVGGILRDTVSFSTAGMVGLNSLWMEVNPYINGSMIITDQPEQEHFNNLLEMPFYVTEDSINPILDVTFNGNHILNGDIIAPNSEILITLKDENEYLIMDDVADTVRFGVYITDPSGNLMKIPFTDGQGTTVMQWVPATAQNKRFKIIWPASFEKDGTYTLLVQGADKSGNLSGDIEYRINFEIVHESAITQMMNYPNPFSTSTRFVFTLTGSEPPDDIIIQIMTVSGRVVREITEDELGVIQIGRNITDYAWDGTDEFGDPLANGVYLYRVRARLNGEDIKRRDSGADQYFEKDFGKMYILR